MQSLLCFHPQAEVPKMAETFKQELEASPAVAESPAVASSLRLAAHMAALASITPAVAHDLRAPINAMVFNLEILKETVASGKGNEPGGRERQMRYLGVLKEELARLHRGMEIFLTQVSARGDRVETFDLREPVEELAALLVAPARKQQVQVHSELPESPVTMTGNRYLLRQALLQVGLAALAGVGRGQVLAVELRDGDDPDRPAVLWMGGLATSEGTTSPSYPPVPIAPEPVDGVDPIDLARQLLHAQGGILQAAQREGGERGYEVDLAVLV
jgi:hypothetical protein